MPRASPTKFATVIGACFSYSSQVNVPSVVSIFAVSGPLPETPLVACSSVKLPFAGSSSSARATPAASNVARSSERDTASEIFERMNGASVSLDAYYYHFSGRARGAHGR